MSVTFTVTLHAWWLAAYLALGVVAVPIFGMLSYRRLASSSKRCYTPWSWFRSNITRRWWYAPAAVALWPLGVWEEVR